MSNRSFCPTWSTFFPWKSVQIPINVSKIRTCHKIFILVDYLALLYLFPRVSNPSPYHQTMITEIKVQNSKKWSRKWDFSSKIPRKIGKLNNLSSFWVLLHHVNSERTDRSRKKNLEKIMYNFILSFLKIENWWKKKNKKML